MDALLSNDNASQEVIALTQLRQDFLSTITFATRRSSKKNKKKSSLEKYLRNPLLDINFEIQGISPLAEATAKLRVLENILQYKGVDLNFCNCDGRTSLFFAIKNPQTDSLRLLIDKGSFIDQKDNEGRTSLSIAAELGRFEHVKLLIESNADINAADSKGWTPLFWAVSRGQQETAKYLLSNQAVNSGHQDVNGRTIWAIAAEIGDVEVLRALLDTNADVNSVDLKKRTALAWAVKNRQETTVKFLLSIPGICVDSRDMTDQTPLIIAASLNENNILIQLLALNAAINSEDGQKWTPLSWAAANGDEQAVESLLKISGIIVDHQDGQGRTPFSLAAEHGFIQIMHLLIRNGADPHFPDNEGHTSFWWFLKARHDLYISSPNQLIRPRHGGTVNPFSLQFLIWALPIPSKKDQSGRNWLSWAAEYGDAEVIQYFVQNKVTANKVDVNICDGTEDLFFRTPLIWALERGHKASIDLLKKRDTASLHLLIEGVSSIKKETAVGFVKTLIQVGYETNQRDSKGRTPLHLACLKGSQELVSALITGKVDMKSKDHTGETPLQCALKAQSKALVDLLLKDPSTDLKPVRSQEFLTMANEHTTWIQITRTHERGHRLELINDDKCDWFPSAKETRLW